MCLKMIYRDIRRDMSGVGKLVAFVAIACFFGLAFGKLWGAILFACAVYDYLKIPTTSP